MSLKAIEMQVALPRTLDAGKIQEQMLKQGQNMTNIAQDAVQKELERKRNSVMKNEQSAETKLHKDEKEQDQERQTREPVRVHSEEIEREHHPYKGINIDYSR